MVLYTIALQQACINLDKAFQKFFDPKDSARYPKFKRKHGRQSSYHCTSISAGENWIKVPKLESIKVRIHRNLDGKLKSITLSRTVTGKYYASLLFEDGVTAPAPIQMVDHVLGVDMGLTHLAKTHERLANARADFQHKLSRQLIDENQAVVVETLKVKNLLKNRKLSKHIADASWSALIKILEYKAKAEGKHLVKIDQWYASSKTCSCCGHKVDQLPLSVRNWSRPSCAVELDRDINAAINIRQQGIIKLRTEGLSVPVNRGLHKSGQVRLWP